MVGQSREGLSGVAVFIVNSWESVETGSWFLERQASSFRILGYEHISVFELLVLLRGIPVSKRSEKVVIS